jgi:hypothetical protein
MLPKQKIAVKTVWIVYYRQKRKFYLLKRVFSLFLRENKSLIFVGWLGTGIRNFC